MADTATTAPTRGGVPDWRARAIRDPETILEDRALMRALTAAADAQRGANVVDMRGLAMERLEARLDRLEDTHRAVVANAYDNLAGTNQIHRCVLALIGCVDLPELLDALEGQAATTLRLASVRLVIEGEGEAPHRAMACLPHGAIGALLGLEGDAPPRPVTLRAGEGCGPPVHRIAVGSEALLALDLGPGRGPALLALGSTDPTAFHPGQGTDLLTFLGACAGGLLRRTLGA